MTFLHENDGKLRELTELDEILPEILPETDKRQDLQDEQDLRFRDPVHPVNMIAIILRGVYGDDDAHEVRGTRSVQ